MRHVSLRSAAAAAALLLFPALALASNARMTGLNVPSDYVKEDWTGMFTYLSEVNTNGNLAYVEAGSAAYRFGDHAVGAVLPGLFDGRFGVWSVNLRQARPAMGQGGVLDHINSGWGGYDDNYTGEAFDLIWGRKLGSGQLGLRINRAYESVDDGTTTVEGNGTNQRNVLGFGAGYGWDMNSNLHVQLSGQLERRSFDDGGATGDHTDGTTGMLLAGRAFQKASGNLTVIPAVKFYSLDLSYTDGETSTDVTEKWSGLQAGVAGNWTVGSGDLLVFGAQFARNHVELDEGDYETEMITPNVFLALETHLNPWLTFRAGAQNAMFYQWSNSFSNVERVYKQHDFSFNFGTSVKLGNLTFDATLDPAFLQNPFAQLMGGTNAYFVGAPSRVDAPSYGGVVFPQVSASYRW
ncbi:MAG: hypothetical protein U0704_16150 [Candidatus Eisenbacteria bacterium]